MCPRGCSLFVSNRGRNAKAIWAANGFPSDSRERLSANSHCDHASNLDEGLAVVVCGVKEYLAADACSVYLVDAGGSNFVLMATDSRRGRPRLGLTLTRP